MDRFEKGREILNSLDEGSSQRVLDDLKDIAPDFVNFILEFAYGEVYSRPGLDLKNRMLITITSLAATGGNEPQLKVHIQNALNVGWTKEEIIETFMQIAVYAGFPRALNAINTAKKVFSKIE